MVLLFAAFGLHPNMAVLRTLSAKGNDLIRSPFETCFPKLHLLDECDLQKSLVNSFRHRKLNATVYRAMTGMQLSGEKKSGQLSITPRFCLVLAFSHSLLL